MADVVIQEVEPIAVGGFSIWCPTCRCRSLRPEEITRLELGDLRLADDGINLATYRLACPECAVTFPMLQLLGQRFIVSVPSRRPSTSTEDARGHEG